MVTTQPALECSWNYQTGDFSQWTQQQVDAGNAADVVETDTPYGLRQVARFTVAPVDYQLPTGTQRSEVRTSQAATAGIAGRAEVYQWATLYPEAPQMGTWKQWQVFTQWHQDANLGSPNVEFRAEPASDQSIHLSVIARGGAQNLTTGAAELTRAFDLGLLPVAEWMRFRFRVNWSPDPTVGLVAVELNDKPVLAPVNLATLYTGQSTYLKQGLYRAQHTSRAEVWHTATHRYSAGPLTAK